MAHLQLSFLGSPQVRTGDQLLNFATRKALALLVYLVVEPGLHPRDRLQDLLWPESNSTRGRGALRTALAYLRRAFAEADSLDSQDFLIIEPDALGFNFKADFELDLRQATEALRSAQMAQLEAVVAACRGEFLSGFSLPDAPDFDEWAAFQREAWHRQLSAIFDRLSDAQAKERQLAPAIEVTTRWLAHDPLNEAAHRRLLTCYALSGDRTAALRAYAACVALLEAELGTMPSPETTALAQRIEQGMLIPTDEASLTPRPIDEARLLDPPFVGRSTQFAQLIELYHQVAAGRTQVAIIEGEAGIGKTRLVAELMTWAALQGVDLLRGRAFETGGRLPYQPLVEALRVRLEAENAPDDLLADVWLSELSRLLPELRERYPDLPPPTSDETLIRTRLLEATARLFDALAKSAPVLLFVDDLQWADTASLDLLHYLARRATDHGGRLFFLLTLRAEALAADPALESWLTSLARDAALTRLSLDALSSQETGQLIELLSGSTADASTFAAWLFTETSGQPFFMAETLKVLQERGVLSTRIDADGRPVVDFSAARLEPTLIPPTVRQLILTRLNRLPPTGTALLTAAAVLGRDCDFSQLCRISGVDEIDALTVLDNLLTGRLMVETSDPLRPYRFAHDKIRDVVYTEAGDARRRVYHRRALETLAQAGAPPAELAHHALVARLTEAAYGYSLAAGDAAMRLFALREAVVHYEQARTLLMADAQPQIPASPPENWSQLYQQLGRAYELLGEYAPAETVCREMLTLAQSQNRPEVECLALNRLGSVAIYAHRLEQAGHWLHQAVTVAEAQHDEKSLAQTYWSLGQLTHHAGDFQASGRYCQQALTLARRLADTPIIAGALNTLAYARLMVGHVAEGESALIKAKDLFVTLGNQALEADCWVGLAVARLLNGQPEPSRAAAQAAVTLNKAMANSWGLAISQSWLVLTLIDLGDYNAALMLGQQTIALARPHGGAMLMCAAFTLGLAQLAVLDIDAARTTLQAAVPVIEAAGVRNYQAQLTAYHCLTAALADDWSGAYTYACQAVELQEFRSLPLYLIPYWLEVEALLRGGDFTLAEADAQRWEALVGHLPRYRPIHQRALALLAEARGERQQAIHHLAEALAQIETMGLSGERWSIQAALGRLYRAEGDKAKADQSLTEAARLGQALAERLDNANTRATFEARFEAMINSE